MLLRFVMVIMTAMTKKCQMKARKRVRICLLIAEVYVFTAQIQTFVYSLLISATDTTTVVIKLTKTNCSA